MDPLIVQAEDVIKLHEGFGSRVYRDPRGFWTIGYGRNIDTVGISGEELAALIPNGITIAQASLLLSNDIQRTINWLSTYSWWNLLTNNRKLAMIDMGFNIGPSAFSGFTDMISALQNSDYKAAANAMVNSIWYKEVGQRAEDDVMLMIKG